MDNNCQMWLWGGAAFSVAEYLNDLWKFIPDPACPSNVSCSWSCVQGSSLAFTASATSLCEKFCINFYDLSVNNPTAWQWIFQDGSPSSSTVQDPVNICYQTPGVFDVTLITTSASGNDTLTLNNYVTVYATPPFPVITQIGYTLTSSPSSSYQWQFNSTDIPGATNQSYTILQTGYYTVIVSDSNGCVNSATTYVLISGINDLGGDSNISIYPNPSDGNFIVELVLSENSGEVSIDILNTLGQEVFSSQQKISSAVIKQEMDLSDVARGVYFIQIKTEKEFVRKKILIE
jgi:PKD repeat protein